MLTDEETCVGKKLALLALKPCKFTDDIALFILFVFGVVVVVLTCMFHNQVLCLTSPECSANNRAHITRYEREWGTREPRKG